MLPNDTRIVTSIITKALAKGYTISVHDGEAYVLGVSTEPKDVLASLNSTGEDTLIFRKSETDRERIGSIYLVHGNEDGVIVSDHSDNAAIQELMQ